MHRNNAALLLQIFLLPVATLAFAWPPTLNTLPASGNVHSIHQSLFVQRGSLKGVRYCRNNDFSAHQSSQCRSSNTLPLFALGTSSGSFEHTPQNTLRGGVNQQGAFRSSFTSAPLIASPSGRGARLARNALPIPRLPIEAAGLATILPEQFLGLIPMSAVKSAMVPIIIVVVLCFMAAIPLSPSVAMKPPDPVGDPASKEYKKASKLKAALGLQRRVFTSVTLGFLASAWIFSGTWAFALVCGVAGWKALNEYYSMAENASDCRPAKKCGMAATMVMYATACGTAYGLPFAYTDCVLPVTYILIVGFLLTKKRTEKMTIADVQTTFMGIFYVGYLSSFWIRLRALGVIPPAEIMDIVGVSQLALPGLLAQWTPDIFTQGAVVTWWTMISIAASDVGAYFAGKNLGRTKLSEWTGITVSPNKTVEGFFGGILLCSLFATTGAKLMNWPLWWVSGPFYAVMISSLGLLGDLTVSLFKRDAGMKDTGNLLPGHGGILDRIDSYMLTAAPVYYFVKLLSRLQGYPTPP